MPVIRPAPKPLATLPKLGERRVESDAHGANKTESAADSFAHVKRDPAVAVAFVRRFNAELGLDKKAIKRKDESMGSLGQHFLTAMPALYYKDVRGPFASLSRLRDTPSPKGLLVGDAHLGNLLTRSGPSSTVWGFSDCDKSGTGPLELDLDRLATHALLVAREAHKSLSADDERKIVDALFDGYNSAMRAFAESGARPNAWLTAGECSGDLAKFVRAMGAESEKKFVKHHCPHGDFAKSERANAHDDAAIRSAIAEWATRLPPNAPVKRPVRVLATGSVPPDDGGSSAGLVKHLALLDGDPPALVRLKPVLPSAPDDGTGHLSHADAAKDVERTSLLEGHRDPLLGYASCDGKGCLVKPERANEDIFDFSDLGRKDLARLAHDAGTALARSQLQSRDVTRSAIATWLGDPSTDAAASAKLLRFARDYADQTERDRKALRDSL